MIPDYQTLMLPLLKFINDEKIHNTQEIINHLAKVFNLTKEELNEFVPSGQQKIFANRISWAKSHLKMSGAIENMTKGNIKITDKGKLILAENPQQINIKYLMSFFPDYGERVRSFRFKKKDDSEDTIVKDEKEADINETPEEQIESGYQKIRETLEQELLSKLKTVDPYFFERIVVELLVKMGYGGSIQDAGRAIGKAGDEGIDGIIKEDKLGLDVIYIQAKRWEGVVGRPEVQKFVGALAGQRAKKGVFITTSNFTKEATQYAMQMDTKIVLIDGEKLAQYMIDYNLGVSVQNTYEIKKIDSDYFEEE
ncbi:restriction endonuclease [Ferruginibacter sp.]|nr:restriction endonuclease [Ferruginibacter sp.]